MEKNVLVYSSIVLVLSFFATFFDSPSDSSTGQIIRRQLSPSASPFPISPSPIYDAVCGNDLCEVGETAQRCPYDCDGIWISTTKLQQLPLSGSGWTNVLATANQPSCTPDLTNQNDFCNVRILAKALVSVRIGQTVYRDEVMTALRSIATSPPGSYTGRALSLARELGTYVLAADIIDLPALDPLLDAQFRNKLVELQTTFTSGGPSNLLRCHEDRPNNWGTHCGATRLALAAYLNDQQEIARSAQIFKGWLGDLASYNGFTYGSLSWQCDPQNPTGINPSGCTLPYNGMTYTVDGVLPDDQRRGGSFTWPPFKENYVWEALQGAVVQAEILSHLGYDSWNWEDQALRRAIQWLHIPQFQPSSGTVLEPYLAEGDDTWIPWLINKRYGTFFPAPTPTSPGKNMGWTEWTHQ